MNEKKENEQLIQSVIDDEVDFIASMKLVGEASFSVDQWRMLALGLMEDRLMRSAAFQFQGQPSIEMKSSGPPLQHASTAGESVHENSLNANFSTANSKKAPTDSSVNWKPLLAVAASVLLCVLSFGVGQRWNDGFILAKDGLTPGGEPALQFPQGGTEVPERKESPISLVHFPVDLEQLEKEGRFNRSEIEDAFISEDQRKQLIQSGFLVDELVGTTVLNVSPRVKQSVATRLICVRYVGDLSVQ